MFKLFFLDLQNSSKWCLVNNCFSNKIYDLRMKNIVCFMFCAILVSNLFCQEIVRKIDLYVIPLNCSFRVNLDYKKVKKLSKMHIKIKDANFTISNNEFLDLIKCLSETKQVEISKDFRIKCVVRKTIGNEVLYFNKFLDFQYNGKTYRDENIKLFILSHLPESYKL